MKIKELKLINFRNYTEISIKPNKLNIIVGDNAQGKSNLLEAIYYLGNGFSFRTNQNNDLIKWSQNFLKVEGICENKFNSFSIKSIFENSRKKIMINEKLIKNLPQLFGNLPVCIFKPDDLSMVKGSPGIRREFMDRDFVLIFPSHYATIKRFQKINTQRNNLLKKLRYSTNAGQHLEEWDELYIKNAYQIVAKRFDFLRELKPFLQYYLKHITKGREKIKLKYKINGAKNSCNDCLPSFKDYQEDFRKHRKREILKGNSLFGPNRDDFEIYINDYDVKKFGSQGQQRTVSLCIKLSYLEVIKKKFGEYPILLLDDVMSELDLSRRELLTGSIHDNIQTFITTTDLELVKGMGTEFNIYKIENGQLL